MSKLEEKCMFIQKISLVMICIILSLLCSCGGVGGGSEKAVFNYGVKTIEGEDGVELQLFYGENHFLTMSNRNGVFEIVPHPGTENTEMGTVWVAQPYIQGALLGHTTTTTPVVYTDVINIKVIGYVSKEIDQKFGLWSMELDFSYDSDLHEISATGQMGISLLKPLSTSDNDLCLFKINSQYLKDVALLPLKYQPSNQTIMGDTGWLEKVIMRTSDSIQTWLPQQQPILISNYVKDNVIVDIIGDYFHPDTAAYGLDSIESKYKAGMTLSIKPKNDTIQLAYEFTYDTDKQQELSSTNVKISPFIRSGTSLTNYEFDIVFSSRSPEQEDGTTSHNSGASCNTILHNNLSRGDGIYWVDIDENPLTEPTQVYCDMSTNDGGWMLYASINQPQDIEITSSHYTKNIFSPDLSNINTGNWILPAYLFDQYISIMRLNMGSVTDFFKPGTSCSFEDMLVSNRCHLWASSPSGPFQQPDYSSSWLGGSAHNWPRYFVEGDERFTLSFWGSNNDGGSGGCCSSANSPSEYNWGKSFKLWVR